MCLPRIILWSSRLLCVAIALWWPRIWCDPIYTPRQARLTGQELRLPSGAVPATADEQAMALFWNWSHRTLVTTQWGIGSYSGLRRAQGRLQTLLVLVAVWGMSSGLLFVWGRKTPGVLRENNPRKGWVALLTTPLWKFLLMRFRRDVPSS